MGDFFIKRPKFAMVISLLIMLAGGIALKVLPISLYPKIAPPKIRVSAQWTGANAEIMGTTVAPVLEAEINGVENMISMDSRANDDGTLKIFVTFAVGTDPDQAMTEVQNRVSRAQNRLPEDVRRQGVVVQKVMDGMVMSINLTTPDGSRDFLFLANYAETNIIEELARIQGVGDTMMIGRMPYAMRVWTDPEKMAAMGMSVAEVNAAIASQNIIFPAGEIGARPVVDNASEFKYTIRAQGRLETPEEFENIIVRANADGSQVLLKDVAEVELGGNFYEAGANLNGSVSPIIAIYPTPDANDVQLVEDITVAMEQLSARFPEGVDYEITYDSSEFIKTSMNEVFQTLILALILVAAITYLFLQSWRTTIIPVLAIPVSLLGTLAVMMAVGIDINTISMFGLVLAIGLVVDACIVVVENVETNLEQGLDSVTATSKAMKTVTGPLIAAMLVLIAVFAPVAMTPGMVGIIYAQFGIVITVAAIISTLVAMTLAPALAALIMKAERPEPWFLLRWFNSFMDKVTFGYLKGVNVLVRHFMLALVLFGSLLALTGGMLKILPGTFVSTEDQGNFMAEIFLPESASVTRTEEVLKELNNTLAVVPGVRDVVTASGFSLLKMAAVPNAGVLIVTLDDWADRTETEKHVDAIMQKTNETIWGHPDAMGFAFTPPALPGMGGFGGVNMQINETSGLSIEAMKLSVDQFVAAANELPEVANAFHMVTDSVPYLYLDIDRARAMSMGVPLPQLYNTIAGTLGANWVNDITLYGRSYMVRVSSKPEFRQTEDSLNRIYTPNNKGDMVPLSSFAELQPSAGSDSITRFNLYNSIRLTVNTAPGYSSGETITALTRLAEETLPPGYTYDWFGQAREEVDSSGSAAVFLFLLALLVTYLALVAQYESWITPIAIILCVPTALAGGLLFTWLSGGMLSIYTQVGMVLMIAMASRNAILIVEFAKVLREEQGLSIVESALEAARARFRAIMMTAFSFVLGVMPLLFASGAGEMARQAIGQVSFGGMLSATVAGCLLVPPFFVVLQTLREKFVRPKRKALKTAEAV